MKTTTNHFAIRTRLMTGTGLCAVGLAGVLGLTGCDQQPAKSSEKVKEEIVEESPNGSYVSLAGTVVKASPDHFVLDYGPETITVEMDDWDWYPEGSQLLENDDVVVHGFIDDDFYERRTIEASSVYVSDVGTQFYASGVDEEDFPIIAPVAGIKPWIEFRGTVTKVDGDEFHLNTGTRILKVETEDMPYNPLDDEGFQKIKKNDRVSVSGYLDHDLFEKLELVARRVTTLHKSKSKEEAG